MAILKAALWLLLLCVGIGVIIGAAYAALLATPFLIAFAFLGVVLFTIGTLIVEAKEEKEGKNKE